MTEIDSGDKPKVFKEWLSHPDLTLAVLSFLLCGKTVLVKGQVDALAKAKGDRLKRAVAIGFANPDDTNGLRALELISDKSGDVLAKTRIEPSALRLYGQGIDDDIIRFCNAWDAQLGRRNDAGALIGEFLGIELCQDTGTPNKDEATNSPLTAASVTRDDAINAKTPQERCDVTLKKRAEIYPIPGNRPKYWVQAKKLEAVFEGIRGFKAETIRKRLSGEDRKPH